MKHKLVLIIILNLIFFATLGFSLWADPSDRVLVMTVEGPVSPIMLGYIERGIEAAEQQAVEALIIQLDTPGGQIDLTKEIVQAIIQSDVPVVVYVYPPGAFAASAGTFITLAGHVAAMAPHTSIGAASPVSSDGGEITGTMRSKVENILVADIESLAERRGQEVVDWAKEAIIEAKADNAAKALELGVVDFIAEDVNDLLEQMDGFEIELRGETHVFETANDSWTLFEMTLAEQILAVILLPQVIFLLLSIGPLAIIYELANPGGYITGIIGLICLVLGLYGIGQLPVNYAGIGLMILAFVLFAAEIFTPTYGALTIAGMVSFILGGLFLFNTPEFDYQVPLSAIIATAVSLGAIFFFIIGKAVSSLRLKPASGMDSLVGGFGTTKTELNPKGIIFADGTRWQATTEGPSVAEGEEVEIVGVQGLRLRVRKK